MTLESQWTDLPQIIHTTPLMRRVLLSSGWVACDCSDRTEQLKCILKHIKNEGLGFSLTEQYLHLAHILIYRNLQMSWIYAVIPFFRVHVTAECSQRQEGQGALWRVVLLQETSYI